MSYCFVWNLGLLKFALNRAFFDPFTERGCLQFKHRVQYPPGSPRSQQEQISFFSFWGKEIEFQAVQCAWAFWTLCKQAKALSVARTLRSLVRIMECSVHWLTAFAPDRWLLHISSLTFFVEKQAMDVWYSSILSAVSDTPPCILRQHYGPYFCSTAQATLCLRVMDHILFFLSPTLSLVLSCSQSWLVARAWQIVPKLGLQSAKLQAN